MSDQTIMAAASRAAGTAAGSGADERGTDERGAGGGAVAGTLDRDDSLIWFTEQCLSQALRLQAYLEVAERSGDPEAAELFRRALADSRRGAEQSKRLLAARLSRPPAGGDPYLATPLRNT